MPAMHHQPRVDYRLHIMCDSLHTCISNFWPFTFAYRNWHQPNHSLNWQKEPNQFSREMESKLAWPWLHWLGNSEASAVVWLLRADGAQPEGSTCTSFDLCSLNLVHVVQRVTLNQVSCVNKCLGKTRPTHQPSQPSQESFQNFYASDQVPEATSNTCKSFSARLPFQPPKR